ncbi:MAG: M56 family metallopeptidase [Gemmatimonadetes bacterium]|nr:M56 family metallopeptidase [Gemmatimonadota bacterium]
MILSAMEFLRVASLVAAAGATLAEAGLRHLGLPTRIPWLAAMAMGPALLAARILRPAGGTATSAPPAWLPAIELPGIGATDVAPWGMGLDGIAALAWLASAAWMLAVVARTHRALTVESAVWERARVMGRDVLVSVDRGPAVAGVWDPWIVLPRWTLALPERELRLILLHEEEHVWARDTHLLGLALALVSVNAWNPVAWWQLGRLRAATEVDCDRRVLRREPDRATYGASLIAVAARGAGPSLGLAAFTEGPLNLKRRILAMTRKATGWTALGGGVLLVLGVVVGVQACGIESPMAPQDSPERSPAVVPAPEEPPPPPAGDLGKAPQFTPNTVAPDLVNREKVMTALEKAYPADLRAAKVGGTSVVFIFIDERGAVGNVVIKTGSGRPELDEAALQVGRAMRFSPARNRDAAVPVWVSLPITFQTL